MGFKIVNLAQTASILIDQLDPQQIFDLINCYASDYTAEDIECRKPDHDGLIIMNYPIITKEVVQQFYEQLDLFRETVKDIIVGNYHIGHIVGATDGTWVWGRNDLSTIADIQYWVFFIIKRDFAEEGTWLYTLTEGNVDALQSFIYSAVQLFIQANDHGDTATALNNIRTQYPFIQD